MLPAKPQLHNYWPLRREDEKGIMKWLENCRATKGPLSSAAPVSSDPSKSTEVVSENLCFHLVLSKCNSHLSDSDSWFPMGFTAPCELHSLALGKHSLVAHWPTRLMRLSIPTLVLEKNPTDTTIEHHNSGLSDLFCLIWKRKEISSWTDKVYCL